jgi:hypothetical protein
MLILSYSFRSDGFQFRDAFWKLFKQASEQSKAKRTEEAV